MPKHAETITTQISMDVAGVQLIGLPCGNLYPTITVNGAIDGIDIGADNCRVSGFCFGAPGTDSQTSIINIDAANAHVSNLYANDCSATSINVLDCITVTANADDCLIEDVVFFNETVAVTTFVTFEGAAERVHMRNCIFWGDVASGGIEDDAKVDYLILENIQCCVVGTTKPALTLDSNPEGIIRDCFFAGTHGTLATNANPGNLMRIDNMKVLEETDASASAVISPAVDSD